MLPTMLDPDLRLPMVAPHDVGVAAADLLTRPAPETGVHFVEGTERHTPADVASAFGSALGRSVEVTVTPGEGGSPPSARWGSQRRPRSRMRA